VRSAGVIIDIQIRVWPLAAGKKLVLRPGNYENAADHTCYQRLAVDIPDMSANRQRQGSYEKNGGENGDNGRFWLSRDELPEETIC
jgi:hypothetical protein